MPRAIAPPRVPLAKPVEAVPAGTLRQLRLRAADCRACPLWRDATQTVFGAGPARAAVMLIGEQPGDQEDRQGEPFVGPAGQLLRQLLAECGLAADEVYLTNTVKHFKFSANAASDACTSAPTPPNRRRAGHGWPPSCRACVRAGWSHWARWPRRRCSATPSA